MIGLSDILAELQRAEDATKALPELRRKVDELEHGMTVRQDQLNSALNNVDTANARIAELEAKLRSTEEERDNVSFRNLELEEAANKINALIGATVVKPVEPEPVAVPSSDSATSATGQTDAAPVDASSPGTETGVSVQPVPTSTTSTTEGSGTASDPFTAPSSESPSPSAPTDTSSASGPEGVPVYAGRKYYDKPHDVSWEEWTKHGGENKPSWIG